MSPSERLEGETTEQYIMRCAHEIHMEEAYINDLSISDEEQAYRSAKAHGLIPNAVLSPAEEAARLGVDIEQILEG